MSRIHHVHPDGEKLNLPVHLNAEHGHRSIELSPHLAELQAIHDLEHGNSTAEPGEIVIRDPALLRVISLAVDNRFIHLVRMKENKVITEGSFLACCRQLAVIKNLLVKAGVEDL